MAKLPKPTCEVCGRVLSDPESIERGLGPECAGQRAAFYAGAGLSADAVDVLMNSPEPDVRRWLRSCQGALRHRDYSYARRFFLNAQRAAGLTLCLTEED